MAIVDRLGGFNIGAAVKPACAVASTGALTLQGAQTVDGISIGSCERVLVKDQADSKENGIYIADSSTWIRARDFDGAKDVLPGTLVYVDRGTNHATSFWVINSSSTASRVVIGSTGDDITASRVTVSLAGVTAFAQAVLQLASAAAWRSTDGLGLGSASTLSSTAIGLRDSTGMLWTGLQSWSKGADIMGETISLSSATGNYFNFTGGSTITSISAVQAGAEVKFHFNSTASIAHSTAIVLPSSETLVIAAGDEVTFTQYTTGADWRLTGFLPSDGRAFGAAGLVPASQSQMTAENTSTALAVTPGVQHYHSGHPKAVIKVSDTTSTSQMVTTTYSAIGEILATRNGVGAYAVTWDSSMSGVVVMGICTGSSLYVSISGSTISSTSVGILIANANVGGVDDSTAYWLTIWGNL